MSWVEPSLFIFFWILECKPGRTRYSKEEQKTLLSPTFNRRKLVLDLMGVRAVNYCFSVSKGIGFRFKKFEITKLEIAELTWLSFRLLKGKRLCPWKYHRLQGQPSSPRDEFPSWVVSDLVKFSAITILLTGFGSIPVSLQGLPFSCLRRRLG